MGGSKDEHEEAAYDEEAADEEDDEAEGDGDWGAALRGARFPVGTRVVVDEGTAPGVRDRRAPPSPRSSRATAAMGLSPSRRQQERPVPAHASHLLSANNRGERPFALMQQLVEKEGLEFIGSQVWTRSSARSTSWAATTRETSRLSPSLVASSEVLKDGLQPRLRRLARRTPGVECSLADFVGRANGHLKGLWTTASALC